MSVQQIAEFLERYADPVFLVGGYVRQRLLGETSDDIDLIVSRNAIQLAKNVAQTFQLKWIVLDAERDMARVFTAESSLDIAAYGDNLLQDLRQRDLSINALAYPISAQFMDYTCPVDTSSLVDPCEGLKDLYSRVLRGISFGNFQSDPLRLLRLFRFAATLKFTIEAGTLDWVKRLKELILLSAPERVLVELNKLLSAPYSAASLKQMELSGLAAFVFREPDHLLERIEGLEICEKICLPLFVKQAALGSYLKTCLVDKRRVLFLLKLFILIGPGPFQRERLRSENLRMAYALSRAEIDCLILWAKLLELLADIFVEPGNRVKVMQFFRLGKQHTLGALMLYYIWFFQGFSETEAKLWGYLVAAWSDTGHALAHPVDLVDGRDIMRETQIASGPLVGQILTQIQAEQALGLIQSRQAALAYLKALSPNNLQ